MLRTFIHIESDLIRSAHKVPVLITIIAILSHLVRCVVWHRAAFESVIFVEAKRLGGFRVWGKIVGPPMHFARCVFWVSGRF